jgi:ABC-2 type transport system permease protein
MERRLPYLRLLLWLKLKLAWRAYARNVSAAVGAVLLAVLFAPMAVGFGVGSYFGFTGLRTMGGGFDEHLLRAILLGIYLMWVSSPIFGYALSEDYDVSKLLVYPLSPRQLLVGATLGSAVDFGTLLVAPTLLAVIVAFTTRPLAVPLVVLGMAVFLFHTLTLTEAVRLASAGMMRSRRARDLLLLLIPLISMSFYVLTQVFSRRMVHFDIRRLLAGPAWAAISLLPPGLSARGLAAASRGDYVLSIAFLIIMLALSAATLALSAWLMQRVYTGAVTSGGGPRPALAPAAPAAPAARAAAPSGLATRLPPVIAALLEKETKHLRRDPYYKHALLQSVYVLAMIAFGSLGPMHHGAAVPPIAEGAMLWSALAMLLMLESQFAFNSFGMEGAATATLLLFPSPRRQIIIGKNLAYLLALSAANGLVAIAGAALLHQLTILPQVFIWSELALVILIAGGNLSSIWFPIPIVLRRGVPRPKMSLNFAQMLLGGITFSVTGLVGLPVLAAALVPTYWVSRFWLLLTLPIAALYVAFAYALSLHIAEGLLLRREPELIDRLKPVD